ncbi:hypothetical protein [Allostreptomyces psammosilenae]|uniref:Uncharacterized protein n=1 Tax=Allostreptomyces psammosilenae TaxID=1892865 RepID=A0A852ZLL9_9ACTN|nr:hypothetical protein [Allostreptomyces psammosilenae]NYI03286.1 hypothetical protein [Allostreptomyces psammosilenae]
MRTSALRTLTGAALALGLALAAPFSTTATASPATASVTSVTATTATTTAPEATVGAMVTKLTHAQATSMLRNAGITWSSSGNCSDRYNSTCTSFEQVNEDTILGAITLRQASGCALNITGGTETGHASGTYSHWNGYKLDFSLYSCLGNYITSRFTYIGLRGDGAPQYQSASGNIYARESNHWDVLYYNCGGC